MQFRSAFAIICVASTVPLSAQTSRERAVAIDRVEVPTAESFAIDAIGPELQHPWSLAMLPDGGFLVTEKHRGLRHIGADGVAMATLAGLPTNVLSKVDSGFLDVVLDPDFAANRMIYLAFVEGTEEANRTAIWKGRFEQGRLTGGRVIFRSNTPKKGPSHPGGRMLFLPDGTLLLTVGDGYDFKDHAQDPASHLGKVLRLDRQGGVPVGNPFTGKSGYAPEIWTLGHRNIQGLTLDPATGMVWAHEHGPRGGDEVNLLEPGKNYGWPLALFGIDYDGKRISDRLHVEGMADPLFFWAPSIAPSGLGVYHGAMFPEWEGKLLIGALAAKGLVVLRRGRNTGLLVEESRLLTALKWRIRDVRVGGDGAVYLLTDEERSRLLRLTPAQATAAVPSANHPLAPVSFLAGSWQGESRFRPLKQRGAREIAETSTTKCTLILGGHHLRCTTRFVRGDGRVRVIEHTYSQGTAKHPIRADVIGDRWTGTTRTDFAKNPAGAAFVAEVPFEEGGRQYVERITLSPSADGRSLVHTESSRPSAGGEWFETFHWTLQRQD